MSWLIAIVVVLVVLLISQARRILFTWLGIAFHVVAGLLRRITGHAPGFLLAAGNWLGHAAVVSLHWLWRLILVAMLVLLAVLFFFVIPMIVAFASGEWRAFLLLASALLCIPLAIKVYRLRWWFYSFALVMFLAGWLWPGITHEVGRFLRNGRIEKITKLRIKNTHEATTGFIYYTTLRDTPIIECPGCTVRSDGSLKGRAQVQDRKTAKAGTPVVMVNAEEEPAIFNRVHYVRVNRAWNDSDPRLGFDESRIYLIFKGDLSGKTKLDAEASDRDTTTQPQSAATAVSYAHPWPWWYYAIALLVLLICSKRILSLVPAGRVRTLASISLVLVAAWLGIKAIQGIAATVPSANPIMAQHWGMATVRPAGALPEESAKYVETAARENNLSPELTALMKAICLHESGCRLNAPIGQSGEVCAMQIMPEAAKSMEVDPNSLQNPDICFDVAAKLLRDHYKNYGPRMELVALAYQSPELAKKYRDTPWDQIPAENLRGINRYGVPWDAYAYVTSVVSFGPGMAPPIMEARAYSLPAPPPAVQKTPSGWLITDDARRVTPLDITLPAGKYKVQVSGCVKWYHYFDCVGPEGGARASDLWDPSDFYLPNDNVGRPVLLTNKGAVGLTADFTLEAENPLQLQAVTINDRKGQLADNSGAFRIEISKED